MINAIPNLLLPGFPKCGTSSLADILGQHEDIFLAPRKENHFFSKDRRWELGLSQYNSFYSDYNNERYAIDGSQTNLQLHYTSQRIHKTLGNDFKSIIVLRNPIDRAISQYNHAKIVDRIEFRGIDCILPDSIHSLKELLKNEQKEVFRLLKSGKLKSPNETWGENGFPFLYFTDSLYSVHIKNYLNFFSLNNILFVKFEEIQNNQKALKQKISNFLNIDPDLFAIDSGNIFSNKTLQYRNPLLGFLSRCKPIVKKIAFNNVKEYLKEIETRFLMTTPKKTLSQSKYNKLLDLYIDDIDKTERITSLDLSNWRVKK
jgi:hypothetical protein